MLKKSIKTKKYKFCRRHNVAVVVISVVLFLLGIIVVVEGFLIIWIWKAQTVQSNNKITTLILQAAEGLNSPVPIDATTGKYYIPQAHLVLPIKTYVVGTELEYRYSPVQDDLAEELAIPNSYGFMRARTIMINAQNLKDTFDSVPTLQSCARGYYLLIGADDTGRGRLIFSKKLFDGRQLYVRLDNGCTDRNDDFENYLKQIESY